MLRLGDEYYAFKTDEIVGYRIRCRLSNAAER
jgi:hypothetical protein